MSLISFAFLTEDSRAFQLIDCCFAVFSVLSFVAMFLVSARVCLFPFVPLSLESSTRLDLHLLSFDPLTFLPSFTHPSAFVEWISSSGPPTCCHATTSSGRGENGCSRSVRSLLLLHLAFLLLELTSSHSYHHPHRFLFAQYVFLFFSSTALTAVSLKFVS